MQCVSCGHVNPYSVSFCESCGTQFPGETLRPPRPAAPPTVTSSAPVASPLGGYYSPSYAAGQGYGYSTSVPRRTSGMATAGFIFSFLCGLLGLILSIMAYRECQDDSVDGEGLALAGIMISIANMVLGFLIQVSA